MIDKLAEPTTTTTRYVAQYANASGAWLDDWNCRTLEEAKAIVHETHQKFSALETRIVKRTTTEEVIPLT